MNLIDVVAYLDDYLDVGGIPDYRSAYNGLQVESSRRVRLVAVAVDAAAATIDQAVAAGADLMIVHHGLFWGSTAPVTGAYYSRLSSLLLNELALYACHLPLDVHPEVGNNHVLARQLGLTVGGTFSSFEGTPTGVWADAQLDRNEFVSRVGQTLGVKPLVVPAGPQTTRRIGIITGGAGSRIADARNAGCDTFLTGEGAHHTYFDAEELGLNVLYAGHYATETVGVKALGAHLERQFGLDWTFIDHPTGL